MNCKTYDACLEIVSEPENKGAAQMIHFILHHMIKRSKIRSGVLNLTPLNQFVMSTSYMFGFKPFCPFFETFNDMIGRLLAVGYFEPSFGFLGHKKLYSNMPTVTDPQILTMDHLEIGFIACSIPLGVAILIFMVELFMSSCKNSK